MTDTKSWANRGTRICPRQFGARWRRARYVADVHVYIIANVIAPIRVPRPYRLPRSFLALAGAAQMRSAGRDDSRMCRVNAVNYGNETRFARCVRSDTDTCTRRYTAHAKGSSKGSFPAGSERGITRWRRTCDAKPEALISLAS